LGVEPLPVHVDGALRVAAACVGDPDARLQMLEPLVAELGERGASDACRADHSCAAGRRSTG
jgi:hypothetical protein